MAGSSVDETVVSRSSHEKQPVGVRESDIKRDSCTIRTKNPFFFFLPMEKLEGYHMYRFHIAIDKQNVYAHSLTSPLYPSNIEIASKKPRIL